MPLPALRQLLRLQRALRPQLARVRAPLQLIFSRRDPSVDPSNAEEIARAVSSARSDLIYLEDSGHVSPVDRERERLAASIVEFLSGLERAASG